MTHLILFIGYCHTTCVSIQRPPHNSVPSPVAAKMAAAGVLTLATADAFASLLQMALQFYQIIQLSPFKENINNLFLKWRHTPKRFSAFKPTANCKFHFLTPTKAGYFIKGPTDAPHTAC